MLTRVEITKFKSCENLVLEGLGGITALVGRNGAGKTNILQAIDWAARTATGTSLRESELSLDMFDITINLTLPDGQCIYRIQFETRLGAGRSIQESLEWTYPNGDSSSAFRRNGESVVIGSSHTVQIGAISATMPALLAILPAGAPVLDKIGPVATFLRGIRYYPLDEPVRSSSLGFMTRAEHEEWIAKYPANGGAEDPVIYCLIEMALEGRGKFDELKAILGNSGLGLVDDIKLARFSASPDDGPNRVFYSLDFRVGGRTQRLSWNQLSLGTRRVIRVLVSLLYDYSNVMLLEHPEDGIHRALLRKLIGLLKSYSDPTQVILASHSGVVLNSLTPDEARLVSLKSGKTAVRPLSAREIELATHFLEEEGTLEEFLETIQQED